MTFFLKIGGFVAAALTAAALTATPAAAQWLNGATAFADFAGNTGTVFVGDLSHTGSTVVGNSSANTQSAPPIAVGTASLQMETGGIGASQNYLAGQLNQSGVTNAAAGTTFGGSSVNGVAGLAGAASGDQSLVVGSMSAQSTQGSVAVATPWGSGNNSTAAQEINVDVIGIASGPEGASVSVVGQAASAIVDGGN